jgi:CheY-like chemotaxis protein/HPt (histidine-containing phosphotransfer) domain-containing protein
MPDLDGIELARAIRADSAFGTPRLILLTSSAKVGDARIARRAGIDAFLTKPVKLSALYDCLATVLVPAGSTAPAPLVTVYTLAQASAAARAHLLVVDDNPVNQRVAARMLEKMGHRVDVAVNGVEAVNAVSRVRYAAVLMDCQMPEMDGFEATREIRRHEGSDRHTPIIAMTAGAMTGDEEKCLAAGMDAYLSKPVSAETLAAMVSHWIEASAASTVARGRHAPEDLLDKAAVSGLRDLGADDFDSVIRLFLSDGAARVDGLRSALADVDGQAMVRLAHSLQGSSSTFGATALAQYCGELQVCASAGDLVQAATLIESVGAEFVKAGAALRDELADRPAGQQTAARHP